MPLLHPSHAEIGHGTEFHYRNNKFTIQFHYVHVSTTTLVFCPYSLSIYCIVLALLLFQLLLAKCECITYHILFTTVSPLSIFFFSFSLDFFCDHKTVTHIFTHFHSILIKLSVLSCRIHEDLIYEASHVVSQSAPSH